MKEYAESLAEWFRDHADSAKASPMEAYMRGKFPFLGIKTPERNRLTKEFWSRHGIPAGDELLDVVKRLWSLPEREFQNVPWLFSESMASEQGKKISRRSKNSS